MRTSENIINHEMIGLYVTIIDSTNLQIVGLKGKIVDETRSTFVLETANGMRMIQKQYADWEFSLGSNSVIVKGSSITKRSYERLRIKS